MDADRCNRCDGYVSLPLGQTVLMRNQSAKRCVVDARERSGGSPKEAVIEAVG